MLGYNTFVKYVLPLVILAVLVVAVFGVFKYGQSLKAPSVESSSLPTAVPVTENNSTKDIPKVAILAQNLEIPWSLVFLPDRSILFTERPGRVRHVSADGKLQAEPVFTVPDVKAQGEGGLLGITIHPKFNENKYVYFYYTYSGGENTLNRVVRYKFDGKTLDERKVIVDAIPGASNHNGGRIKFGPDGYLYITAGDSQKPSLAQDTNSLAGKILRVDKEGNPAPGSPFNNRVYSYGHRNPQGITWDASGQLWETEHGPSGSWPNCCQDELNRVEKGVNYGWPDSVGDSVKPGTVAPVAHSGRDIWAPSGMAFLNGAVYFSGLRGALLVQAKINGDKVALSEHFKNEFGRLRDVVLGPDGLLYVLTNNRDGRGIVRAGDDKILVINPNKL